jgi:septal ring factor EnvC (AmiA/AmiB activator)
LESNRCAKKLEARKAKLIEEIKLNEKLLGEQKQKEKSVVNVIIQQNAKITTRQELIKTNEKQAKLLSDDIYTNQIKINQLNKDLNLLKEDYAKMIVKSYKSRSEQSRIMFLLSSDNFLQAYKRAQYMKQYSSYRKSQGVEIQKKQEELGVFNEKLAVQKKEKVKIIQEQEKEKELLEKERQEQQKLANSIKKDLRKITADIKKKQQETKDIDRKIQKMIRDAIAAANKKTSKSTGTKTTSKGTSTAESTKIVLDTEGKIASDNFKANKGQLPWPVEKGFVSLRFGSQPHPLEKSLTINSNGVEITTDTGAHARAVFSGTVMLVQVLSPVNKAVMIQHGDFITVYQNLETVTVSKGDKVSTKQSLGRIHTSDGNNKTAMKFSVLQNDSFLNPQSWINNM